MVVPGNTLSHHPAGQAPTRGLTEQVGDWRAFLADADSPEEMEPLRLHTRTGQPMGGVTLLNLLETVLMPPQGGATKKRKDRKMKIGEASPYF